MFGKNTYLQFPQGASSHRNSRISTFPLDLNGASAAELFLHHHPELLSGHYLAANGPVLEAADLFNQHSGSLSEDPSAVSNTFQKKPAAGTKKDRHSKIYTLQGPRDRRVRLSIGIARKFFDLQEMLGFDTPSKTLDWLLTKSASAIKELVQTKDQGQTEELSEGTGSGEASDQSLLQGMDFKGKSVMHSSSKFAKDPQQAAAANLAKASREKARARARERTKDKMCIKNLSEARNKGSEWNPSIPIHTQQYEVSYEGLIQETMKRKAKIPSVLWYQENFGSSRDFTTENWAYNSVTPQSSLCATLNQHKFMN